MNKSSKKLSNFLDFISPFACDQHPFSSHDVGICPHCVKERLMILVCSDCGERRLSSCSCSDIRRNSCCTTADFATSTRNHHTKPRTSFRRSTSNGFARIKRLFFIKKQNLEFCDDENIYTGGGGYESRISCQHQMDQPDRFCTVVFPTAMDDDTDAAFIDLNLHPYPSSSSYESNQEIEFCGGTGTGTGTGTGRSSMSIASDHPAIYRKNHINFQTTSNGISGNGGFLQVYHG